MSKTIVKDDPSEIGQNLFYGISRKRNYRKAFPYLLEAANRGDVHSKNLVGYCYDLGLGVERNKSRALSWFRHAAKFHHKEALFNLAVSYDTGDGVAVNHKKAFSFYKRAAELGDLPAM